MCVPSLKILRLWNMNNRRKVDLKSVNSLLKVFSGICRKMRFRASKTNDF